ncbi:macro domain-containing protein [Paenibacillus paridis]|uniref:macro domain-containing protein n=1 Tax=Paenibacillus paridis TaxID=2583376 RepID=UPI001120752C|nr:macro domain-containing protein [Paenibacillus paridis]
MAVKIIQGDLTNAKEDILGHQVNCQGVMGSGIARVIRTKYPEAYHAFIEKSKNTSNHKKLLGECQLIDSKGDKKIANLFGQFYFGKSSQLYTDYDALRKALTTLKQRAAEAQLSVALPYNIGCGLANGDWNVVSNIIEEVFEDYEVTLYQL